MTEGVEVKVNIATCHHPMLPGHIDQIDPFIKIDINHTTIMTDEEEEVEEAATTTNEVIKTVYYLAYNF